jgi:hypothetical protein
MKRILAFVSLLALALPAFAQTSYNRFGPADGVLVGDPSTYYTTAATDADITALWSGTCDINTYLRGDGACAAAAIAGQALTRVNDTNVTLTLGGSPSTSLVNSTSLTLGWTGTLGVSRGGIGVGTLTGIAKGNGTSAFTAAASTDVRSLWSGTCDSTTFLRGDGSCQTPAGTTTGANPTATIGLSAVNGSAGTFMRSDAAPALSQAIAPLWSALHTFNSSTAEKIRLRSADTTGEAFIGFYENDGTTRKGYLGYGNVSTDPFYIANEENAEIVMQTNATTRATIAADGGVFLGSASGSSQGAGTINATGVYDDGVLLANQVGANPTGTIGLSAVNGSAGTFLRSDGAPALSQAIAPTWSAGHTFGLSGSGASSAIRVTSTVPFMYFSDTDASLNEKNWDMGGASALFRLRAVADDGSTSQNVLNVGRSGSNITTMEFGNATANGNFTFLGTGTTSHGGDGNYQGRQFSAGGATNSSTAVQLCHSSSGYGKIGVNVVCQSGGGENYGTTDVAGQFTFSEGATRRWGWSSAASGTGGTAITWVSQATLDSSGNYIAAGSITAGTKAVVQTDAPLITGANFAATSTNPAAYGTSGNATASIYTNATQRMQVTGAGAITFPNSGGFTLPSGATLNGTNICLSNGTNCPASGGAYAFDCTTSCNVSGMTGGQAARIRKTADTTRTSTTAFTNDPDFVFTNVPAGNYVIEANFRWTGGAGGVQTGIATTGTPVTSAIFWYAQGPSGGTCGAATFSPINGALTDGTFTNYNCTSVTTATHNYPAGMNNLQITNSGTLSLQWAQNSSSGTGTVLQDGSYWILTRIN